MKVLILWLIYWAGLSFVWVKCGEKPAIIVALMYILFELIKIELKVRGLE